MSTVRPLFFLILTLFALSLAAQSFVARSNVPINTNCNGFYEYLPAGYDPGGTALYPLIVACHGLGERGNGGTELSRLVLPGKGLASLLHTGNFPSSFSVGGQSYRFLIICPQFTDNGNTWPGNADLEAVINYAVANYRVDITRIYLTGLSMGGGLSYRYVTAGNSQANRIAALVPICPALQPGVPYAARPDSLACRTITGANLPVWTTHNLGDWVVPVSFTDSLTHYINAAPAPGVPARKTIFTSYADAHDAWTATYDPAFVDASGQNIYQWMLQYRRSFAVLPTTLTRFRVQRSGTSALVDWASASEDPGDRFLLERSSNGQHFEALTTVAAQTNGQYRFTDRQPLPGKNYYRLTLLRADGQKRIFHAVLLQIEDKASLQLLEAAPGNLRFRYTSEETGEMEIRILNEAGSVLKRLRVLKAGKELVHTVETGRLGSGAYLLQVAGKNQQEVVRFMR